jgi:hypothetical protein
VWVPPNLESERELELAMLDATRGCQRVRVSNEQSLLRTVRILAQFDNFFPVCIPALLQNECDC